MRSIGIAEFHDQGCRLAADEVITSIDVPVQETHRWSFRELARNRRCLLNIASLHCGTTVTAVVGGYADRPIRMVLDVAGGSCLQKAVSILAGTPARSDLHGSADYRCHVAEVLLAEVLKELDAE